jgi:hypothetical protein
MKNETFEITIHGQRVTGIYLKHSMQELIVGITAPFGLLTGRRTIPRHYCGGGGFLGPQGPVYSENILRDLHAAGTYLEEKLPQWVQLYHDRQWNNILFMGQMDHLLRLDEPLDHSYLRRQAEQVALESDLAQRILPSSEQLGRWGVQHQAAVLLHRSIRRGTIQLGRNTGPIPLRLHGEVHSLEQRWN